MPEQLNFSHWCRSLQIDLNAAQKKFNSVAQLPKSKWSAQKFINHRNVLRLDISYILPPAYPLFLHQDVITLYVCGRTKVLFVVMCDKVILGMKNFPRSIMENVNFSFSFVLLLPLASASSLRFPSTPGGSVSCCKTDEKFINIFSFAHPHPHTLHWTSFQHMTKDKFFHITESLLCSFSHPQLHCRRRRGKKI